MQKQNLQGWEKLISALLKFNISVQVHFVKLYKAFQLHWRRLILSGHPPITKQSSGSIAQFIWLHLEKISGNGFSRFADSFPRITGIKSSASAIF